MRTYGHHTGWGALTLALMLAVFVLAQGLPLMFIPSKTIVWLDNLPPWVRLFMREGPPLSVDGAKALGKAYVRTGYVFIAVAIAFAVGISVGIVSP